MKNENQISRRKFLKGATAVGAAVSTTLLPISSIAATAPKKWDQETDIIVIGFGSAGSAAAIAASEENLNVTLLEKMPEETAGGATSCYGGIFMSFAGRKGKNFIERSMGSMTPETARKISDEINVQIKWAKDKGLKMQKENPFLVEGEGKAFYKLLKTWVMETPRITIKYSTPATSLIQDPETKEILGVIAQDDGKEIKIKARKGVIITSGDYNANKDMIRQFNFPGLDVATINSPASTGDGMKMGMAAGGALDNMGKGFDWMEFAFREPTEKFGTAITHRTWDTADLVRGTDNSPLNNSRIFVNMDGERFMNEKTLLTHEKFYPMPWLNFTDNTHKGKPVGWDNLPMFLVCDQKELDSATLGKVIGDNNWGWASVQNIYEWSDDNRAEIESGWLIKADTLEELAAKMKAKPYLSTETPRIIKPDALKATVTKYNEGCKSGNDEFDRPKETLKPLSQNGSYYAIELMACGVYNTSGLRYNIHAQTLDYNNEPIPRLYSAGNVGQGLALWPYGVPGCMATGKIAAKHAAKLKSI
ncbi:FAD-dependent oxidoreductase [Shewanella phaeophyticola]|uniref:FAD-binding protein n=1 Tax=Shewanella phaeophyticola TaxID=2978345 RepID=A0ABT2P5J1_9GAMM|nr:FAD-dependent oxidoreductase [Shewanella sp. KJ10-1]MCT8987636.1 FAD-binding protein [Shewanella sp. KJ10-1]